MSSLFKKVERILSERRMSEPHISPQSKQWILQQLQSGHSIDPGLFSFSIISYCCSPIFVYPRASLSHFLSSIFFFFFFHQLVSPRKIGHGFIFISSKLVKVLLPLMLLPTILNNKCNTHHKVHHHHMPHQAQRNHNMRRNRNISKVFSPFLS